MYHCYAYKHIGFKFEPPSQSQSKVSSSKADLQLGKRYLVINGEVIQEFSAIDILNGLVLLTGEIYTIELRKRNPTIRPNTFGFGAIKIDGEYLISEHQGLNLLFAPIMVLTFRYNDQSATRPKARY